MHEEVDEGWPFESDASGLEYALDLCTCALAGMERAGTKVWPCFQSSSGASVPMQGSGRRSSLFTIYDDLRSEVIHQGEPCFSITQLFKQLQYMAYPAVMGSTVQLASLSVAPANNLQMNSHVKSQQRSFILRGRVKDGRHDGDVDIST